MASISSASIEKILAISGLARECAEETVFPPVLFRQMTDLFDSKSAVYYSMVDALDSAPLWDGFGYRTAATAIEQYEQHYRAFDPCFNGLKKQFFSNQPPIASTHSTIKNDRAYKDSEYYQDFLKPQDIHSSIIFSVGDSEGVLGLFGFHRSSKMERYSELDHLKARLFSSQIASSLRVRQIVSSGQRLRAVARKLMSHASIRHYLVFDENYRIIDSSGDAATMLGVGTSRFLVLENEDDSIERFLPKEVLNYTRKLLSPNVAKQSNDDFLRAFDNIHGASRMRVDLLDTGDLSPLVLLIFLDEDSEMISESRVIAFGLTLRERDIVHHVCRGLTTLQMAAALGISEKTVENHLTHIYSKTQARNRAELIRQLSA